MHHLYTLGQVTNEITKRVPKGWMEWLTEDPVGQAVGVGILVAVALVAVYAVILSVNTLRVHAKKLIVAAAIIGGGVWAVQFFDPGWVAWTVIAFISFGCLVGYALLLTHAK